MILLSWLFSIILQADVEMADNLRSDGKFWVVIAVVLIILFGILLYLFMLDKKIGKLEK